LKTLLNMELLYAPFWLMTYRYSAACGESKQSQMKAYRRFLSHLIKEAEPEQPREKRITLVADAVVGQIAFLRGDAEKMVEEEVDVEEDSVIGIAIPIDRVIGKAEVELKKRLLSTYMWKTKTFNLQLEGSQIFYVPFWVGYYRVGREEKIQVEVMNALSGEVGDSWHRGIIEAGVLRMYQETDGSNQRNI